VVGEPFRQWVIEDDFAGRRPHWDRAGAAFVADVRPHELIKMRLLNGVQSALSYYGALAGLDYTCEAASDPVLGAAARRMAEAESAGTVPAVAGMEAGRYIASVFERVTNPAIRHRNHQVATDGSQKIVQRLLNPARERIAAGLPFDFLAAAAAAWMAYLLAAAPRFGARWQPSDPWAAEVARLAGGGGAPAELARAIVAIRPVFGTDLAEGPFVPAVARHLEPLLTADPRPHLAGLLAGGGG
jgi:fructuronate reductase